MAAPRRLDHRHCRCLRPRNLRAPVSDHLGGNDDRTGMKNMKSSLARSLSRLPPLAAAFTALVNPGALQAQPGDAAKSYPSRPIRLIVPFPPGGSNDILGRFIAQKLTERLGQQVIVDNRAGADGIIGTGLAVKAAPDGYTLLIVSTSYAMNPAIHKLPYDPLQ